MREGTFNTAQLRKNAQRLIPTLSQNLSMWTAFNLVYVSYDNQSSQSGNPHEPDTLLGLLPNSLGKRQK